MNKRHKRLSTFWLRSFFSLTIFFFVLFLCFSPASESQAQSNQAYDLIAGVNQLRTASGLPPYEINSSLMASAQGQSDYQASIGSVTHTGSGGTRARDRAAAAGYGGGATIYVSENIAGGMSFTVQSVIQMWQGDSLHLNTMLGASYQDIGAGVATSGQRTYYTIDVGYIAGNSGNSTAVTSGDPAPAAAIAFIPIQVSTPGVDGSILHEVKIGQALWNIAAVYEIELMELLELNDLGSNAFIYPGDKLLIKSAEATLTPTPKKTATANPSETIRKSSITPKISKNTAVAALEPTQSSLATPTIQSSQNEKTSSLDPLLVMIAGLVFGGTILILLGNILKRRE